MKIEIEHDGRQCKVFLMSDTGDALKLEYVPFGPDLEKRIRERISLMKEEWEIVRAKNTEFVKTVESLQKELEKS